MDTPGRSRVKSWHQTKTALLGSNLSIDARHMAISWTRVHRVARDNASFITRSTLKLYKRMLANIAPETSSLIISTACFVMIQRFRPAHISTSAAACLLSLSVLVNKLLSFRKWNDNTSAPQLKLRRTCKSRARGCARIVASHCRLSDGMSHFHYKNASVLVSRSVAH